MNVKHSTVHCNSILQIKQQLPHLEIEAAAKELSLEQRELLRSSIYQIFLQSQETRDLILALKLSNIQDFTLWLQNKFGKHNLESLTPNELLEAKEGIESVLPFEYLETSESSQLSNGDTLHLMMDSIRLDGEIQTREKA
ncbi:MAG: hypothetical protein HC835_21975, partial [Oscillatoriales cyanobacterium RM2_1_1]|nr:hypothetical protein [Oscillatoriales cyanobacterium RM2_1_1]